MQENSCPRGPGEQPVTLEDGMFFRRSPAVTNPRNSLLCFYLFNLIGGCEINTDLVSFFYRDIDRTDPNTHALGVPSIQAVNSKATDYAPPNCIARENAV